MKVGHTRCFVDGNFGLIKQCYRCADIDTVGQLPAVVSRSSRTNAPQIFRWEWRELDKMMDSFFCRLKGIQTYQHFHFTADNGGNVIVKESCISNSEKMIPLLKRGITTENVEQATLPRVIVSPGLSQERK